MTTAEMPSTKCYCNELAIQKGLDPAGNAGSFDDAIIVETPLPWKPNMYKEAGPLPQQIIDLLALWLQRYYDGQGYPHRPLMIAPDPDYSQTGFRRVMYYTRKDGPFSQFDKVEYRVPDSEYGALIWSLYEDRDALPNFEQFRTPEADSVRDILVCTHGTVDAACAKFGYPLYRHMRDTYASDSLRVWRVSHFGGHIFAPTLMDMPTSHYWAYVDKPQARQIVERTGAVEDLYKHYRGWAGFKDSFVQAAEREVWQREGWEWFSYARSSTILSTDADEADEATWAEIRMEFKHPHQDTVQVYDARVEITDRIETISTTGYDRTYAYPQYSVTRLEPAPRP